MLSFYNARINYYYFLHFSFHKLVINDQSPQLYIYWECETILVKLYNTHLSVYINIFLNSRISLNR